jgi:hypothetical protein
METRNAMNFEPRITRMGTDEDRDTQGYAWTSQAGAALSNPFTSKLARDCEKPIAHSAPQMALLRPEISGKKHQFALGFQAGMCCEKASASPLARVFSTTDPAFAQLINTVIFLSSYLTRSLPLISPFGPTFGCSTAHLPRCLVVFIRAIRG